MATAQDLVQQQRDRARALLPGTIDIIVVMACKAPCTFRCEPSPGPCQCVCPDGSVRPLRPDLQEHLERVSATHAIPMPALVDEINRRVHLASSRRPSDAGTPALRYDGAMNAPFWSPKVHVPPGEVRQALQRAQAAVASGRLRRTVPPVQTPTLKVGRWTRARRPSMPTGFGTTQPGPVPDQIEWWYCDQHGRCYRCWFDTGSGYWNCNWIGSTVP